MPARLGAVDILWITLDTLRYDVAVQEWASGGTPFLRALVPAGWERRHTPASFTFAAHASFFAGFLPTPAAPGPHARPFALAFAGSETIGPATVVFDAPDIPAGLRAAGYHTACIGGTGFFNRETPLGNVLPAMFDEAHWDPSLGVTDPGSTGHQVDLALRIQQDRARLFLFINVSAIHQPNRHHLPGATHDDVHTHAAALRYVDGQLRRLFDGLTRPTAWILTSDHGTCYGEDGFTGHRIGHPVVWTVPYAEGLWMPAGEPTPNPVGRAG